MGFSKNGKYGNPDLVEGQITHRFLAKFSRWFSTLMRLVGQLDQDARLKFPNYSNNANKTLMRFHLLYIATVGTKLCWCLWTFDDEQTFAFVKTIESSDYAIVCCDCWPKLAGRMRKCSINNQVGKLNICNNKCRIIFHIHWNLCLIQCCGSAIDPMLKCHDTRTQCGIIWLHWTWIMIAKVLDWFGGNSLNGNHLSNEQTKRTIVS